LRAPSRPWRAGSARSGASRRVSRGPLSALAVLPAAERGRARVAELRVRRDRRSCRSSSLHGDRWWAVANTPTSSPSWPTVSGSTSTLRRRGDLRLMPTRRRVLAWGAAGLAWGWRRARGRESPDGSEHARDEATARVLDELIRRRAIEARPWSRCTPSRSAPRSSIEGQHPRSGRRADLALGAAGFRNVRTSARRRATPSTSSRSCRRSGCRRTVPSSPRSDASPTARSSRKRGPVRPADVTDEPPSRQRADSRLQARQG
jgi:hypothetical protein